MSFRNVLAAALALASAAPAVAQGGEDLGSRVRTALQRARPALLHFLQRGEARAQRPGLLALLCLAALHDGVPTDQPVLAAALDRLGQAEPQQTYDLALRLMVLEAHAGFPDRRALARRDLRELLRHRYRGAFSYSAEPAVWDLSNTQYAALGLRAAESIGIEVPARVWRDLLVAVGRAQNADGSFGYSGIRSHGGGYSSMTVAGIAVLEICAQALQPARRSARARDLRRRLDAAWDWMAKHRDDIGDLRTRSCFYFHYGLERAAILSATEEVGGADWYAEGARMLLGSQLRGGGWESRTDHSGTAGGNPRGEPVATAFAILFLRRKFQRVAAPLTGPRGPSFDSLTEQASEEEVQAAARTAWSAGRRAMPEVLKALRSTVAAQRRAAAIALYRISGQAFGYNPHRGPEHNEEAIRAAEAWYREGK